MAYKPFNLKQAEEQNGEGLITRDGRPARIVCWDRNYKLNGEELPLLVLVRNRADEEFWAYGATKDGRYNGTRGEDSQNDLFMAPAKHEGWINVYKGYGVNRYAKIVHDTKADADENASGDRVACVHIEWEE